VVIRDGIGWGFALSSSTQAPAPHIVADSPAVLKMQEFDALYSNSIANYLTQQTSLTAASVRGVLRDHSRVEAERAQEALSKLPSFEWPGKDGS
jgi:hypothetical protein